MKHVATFAIFGMLAGCAAHTDPAPPSNPPGDPSGATSAGESSKPADRPMVTTGPATAAIDSNLQRLKGLQIFEVGGLLVNNFHSQGNCYGLPCQGEEQQYADAQEVQALRLANFTDTAVKAAAVPTSYDVVTPEANERNLNVLRGLEIVGVGAMIVAKPVVSGNCYGPCPEEVAVCNAINEERGNKLANVAKAF